MIGKAVSNSALDGWTGAFYEWEGDVKVCVDVCVYICAYTCMRICMCVRFRTYLYVHLYTYMRVCVCAL